MLPERKTFPQRLTYPGHYLCHLRSVNSRCQFPLLFLFSVWEGANLDLGYLGLPKPLPIIRSGCLRGLSGQVRRGGGCGWGSPGPHLSLGPQVRAWIPRPPPSSPGSRSPAGFGSVFFTLSESETKEGGWGSAPSPAPRFALYSELATSAGRRMERRGAGRAGEQAAGARGGPDRVGAGMEGAGGRGAGVRVCASAREAGL